MICSWRVQGHKLKGSSSATREEKIASTLYATTVHSFPSDNINVSLLIYDQIFILFTALEFASENQTARLTSLFLLTIVETITHWTILVNLIRQANVPSSAAIFLTLYNLQLTFLPKGNSRWLTSLKYIKPIKIEIKYTVKANNSDETIKMLNKLVITFLQGGNKNVLRPCPKINNERTVLKGERIPQY